MSYLYFLVGVLAFLAARNIIGVRRWAKEYTRTIQRDRTAGAGAAEPGQV